MQVGTVAGETEGRMEKEELRLHPVLAQIQPGHWVIPKWARSLGDSWVKQGRGSAISPVM